jgi:hypothetical protein
VNLEAIRRMADAVLYEGYILYPYRASAPKNRSRWQWGVVMSPGYAAADPSESDATRCEFVLEHAGQPEINVILRFLQVQRRGNETPDGAAAGETWDEAVEREIEFTVGPAELLGAGDTSTDGAGAGYLKDFAIEGGEDREPRPDGTPGYAVRRRAALAGAVTVRAIAVPGPWQALRLQFRTENRTVLDPVPPRREDALPTALVAAHMIITASGGEFISMTDPPMWAKAAVDECENVGGWPVLADPDGGREVMLSAPIILYDHPELAPESPGDLYDGTEIDEILTLRTLTLSDAEKAEARATDPRAAALIDRVESMDPQTMAGLHGAMRPGRPAGSGQGAGFGPGSGFGPGADPGTATGTGTGTGASLGTSYGPGTGFWPGAGAGGIPAVPWDASDPSVPWWDPEADASVSPDTDSVTINGRQIARGSQVRLRPGARRADAQDMFLIGRIADVQAVLLDVDDKPYLAVSLAEDDFADIKVSHGRFLYFTPDEVEPCEDGS